MELEPKAKVAKIASVLTGTAQAGNVILNGASVPTHNGVDTVGNGAVNGSDGYNGFGFLKSLFDLMVTESLETNSVNSKVVSFHHPTVLKRKLDQIDLSLGGSEACTDNDILLACREVIKYSVKTGHPHFFNQLYQGLDIYGLGGAWLTETLNTSQYTYEVAPVFTLMEQAVLEKMRKLMGIENGDGIFTPGGSMANIFAINMARYKRFPEVKTKGMQALPRLCIMASSQSHYSLQKGASLLGLGLESLVFIKTDANGRMIPEELERVIVEQQKENIVPFLVVATCGTTVLGAYDPLEPIADICTKYGIWLHVDAAWGGSVRLSKKHRHIMNGIEKVDSITWNPHKMMGATLQCSAFLTKHQGLLQQCHSAHASYLFQPDKFYDVSYDTGDKSIQCGRKVDALKLWLMWKAKGDAGFEKDVDSVFRCARYLVGKLKNTTGFRLVIDEIECTNVCFWYIPKRLRDKLETDQWWNEVSKVAPKVKELLMLEGTALIGYQPLGDKVNFFRMVVSNLAATQDDMDFVVKEIVRLGENL